MFRRGCCIALLLMVATGPVLAIYCDCGSMTGRPASIPEGVALFDEDDMLTEDQETHVFHDDSFSDIPGPDPSSENTRYMTDVLQIDIERTDGYADRDGLWNDSDPFAILRLKASDGSWAMYGQSGIVGGCDGEACDSVLNYQVEIPVDRFSLYSTRVEIWDDDDGSVDEILGFRTYPQIPISGVPLAWQILDDDPDWQCWAKIRIRYEDNGIANPIWIDFPQGTVSGSAFFSWDNPDDRSGIHHSEIHFSSDEVFDDADEAVFRVWGDTAEFSLDAQHMLASGSYFCALVTIDNHGYDSDIIGTGSVIQWNAPTAVPPSATPTPPPSYDTPTPAPGAFVVGDVRIYADAFDNLGAGRYRAHGNIQINDHVRVEGVDSFLMIQTTGTPWISGQGTVRFIDLNLPVFLGDFDIDPVAGHSNFGLIRPGQFTSLLLQILGFYLDGNPLDLKINAVDGWIYCETMIRIELPEIGLHITHADFFLDWMGQIVGNVQGFSFQMAGVIISFDNGHFTNIGIHIDHFLITLAQNLGGGYAEAWGLNIAHNDIWLDSAHVVLPVIRIDGGFEITGFNPATGPEAWIERLGPPMTGYKWCVDGRIHIPHLADAGPCGIETTFSIYGDQLQQACLSFEGCGLQIPIGSTGLFLYKLGGCVTFNNLPYPDPTNQCAIGTIYDCSPDVMTCCNFDYPDSTTVKLIAGLQGGPDIFGLKAVHADPLWLDINTGWGVGGGGIIRVLNNYEIGAGRVCGGPFGVRVDGQIHVAIVHGSLYMIITPNHAEGAIEGSVTLPPGDYWLFDLDEPLNLGQFLLMLGYYYVPESDFWGSGIWSTCQNPYCSGLKYGVLYSHEIFGQILSVALDQNQNFYAWIDLDFFGSMSMDADGTVRYAGEGMLEERAEFAEDYTMIAIEVPATMKRSLFAFEYQGGQPAFYLVDPEGRLYAPDSHDNTSVFYRERPDSAFYSIKNPIPGTWYAVLDQISDVTAYRVQLLQGNRPPEVEIHSVTVEENRARIAWAGYDEDDPAQVGLFYDLDDRHADGIPIALTIGAGGSGQDEQITHWDLSGIPTGRYYLYAKIEDGRHAPVISYFSEPVWVTDQTPPCPPSCFEGNIADRLIHLWWEAPSDRDIDQYQIRYLDLDTMVEQSFMAAGCEAFIPGLNNGTPYRCLVIAKDFSGNWSAQSSELFLTPQPYGDLDAPSIASNLQAAVDSTASVNLTWTPPSAPDLGGYLIHYGTNPGVYCGTEAEEGPSPVWVEAAASWITLHGLNPGSTYFFNVQAIDQTRNAAALTAEAALVVHDGSDVDADGIWDDWEACYFGTLSVSSEQDSDGDGFSNAQELASMTHPKLRDTDGDRVEDGADPNPLRKIDLDVDGISDDWEAQFAVVDPDADPDSDGLKNIQEYNLGTDPSHIDSDGDKYTDGQEFQNGWDPRNPDSPAPRCGSLGVSLEMPAHRFRAGDVCSLNARLCNNTLIPVNDVRCFVILEAYGQYYFAPGWTTAIECLTVDLLPGPQTIHIIPSFSWPQIPGSASDLRFYAGLTNSDMTTLIGEYDTWEFGWE